MSWSRAQTTYSSSSPARKARVAVWSEWVRRSTAKPPKSPSSSRRWSRTRSARPRAWAAKLFPMIAQSSAVDSSMPVNVARDPWRLTPPLSGGHPPPPGLWSPSDLPLQLGLADLHDRHDRRVVGDVAHDLGHVGAERALEGVDRIEGERADAHVGRRLVRHSPGDALVDRHVLQRVAAAVPHHRHVLVDVVVHVEVGALGPGIHHADPDHVAFPLSVGWSDLPGTLSPGGRKIISGRPSVP